MIKVVDGAICDEGLDELEGIVDVRLDKVSQIAHLLVRVDELVEELLRAELLLEADIDRLRIVEDRVESLREAPLHDLVVDTFAAGYLLKLTGLVDRFADIA